MCRGSASGLESGLCRAVGQNGKVDAIERGQPGTHFCLSLSPCLDLNFPGWGGPRAGVLAASPRPTM